MKMNMDQAHKYVSSSHGKIKVFWNGWDINVFVPNVDAIYKPSGAFIDGEWGLLNKFSADLNGNWKVPAKYV